MMCIAKLLALATLGKVLAKLKLTTFCNVYWPIENLIATFVSLDLSKDARNWDSVSTRLDLTITSVRVDSEDPNRKRPKIL